MVTVFGQGKTAEDLMKSATSTMPELGTDILLEVPGKESLDFIRPGQPMRPTSNIYGSASNFSNYAKRLATGKDELTSTRYPWKKSIVTTVFWIGEQAAKNNPVPNDKSSWDARWMNNYGGVDRPTVRHEYLPVGFKPGQNPFYAALPYNDITGKGTKPEARMVIPWFKEEFARDGTSVCKGRWLAIRKGNKVCYAQWEDCGPFRTDHWEYVFGNERPKPNLNNGAGLDVSPAIKDYLGLDSTDVTDWKFVTAEEVAAGPWAMHGNNNTFVQSAQVFLSDLRGKPR